MIESPCIKICILDENHVCEGCHRTIDEIMAWPTLSDEEKLAVLERIENDSRTSNSP